MNRPHTGRWTTPADLKARLRRQWERGDFLSDSITATTPHPLRLSIKGPTSGEIAADFAAVQEWVATWRQQSSLRIEWKSVGHRLFGTNEIPGAVTFENANDVVRVLGTQSEWETFQTLVATSRNRFPAILPWLARRPVQALDLAPDWERILSVVAWVRDHPRSGRYLRQVDAPGVHSKFIERHRGVLAELLDLALPAEAIDASARGTAGFNRRYGFRDKPERIRFRFLDAACAVAPARLGLDLTLDAQAFSQLDPSVERVFITENEINFLTFPDHPRSLILFGSGYGWSALEGAAWLHRCHVHYWGDIDTHGFAILDQLRSVLPHTKSFLMDRDTLESLRHLCTTEPDPSKGVLQRLDATERSLFESLRSQGSGGTPRLEQERVPFPMVEKYLESLAGHDSSDA